MNIDSVIVLSILAIAVFLFVTEKLSIDLVAMLVLMALILTGLLTPEQAFSGFSSPAVITVWSVFIVSSALVSTGVADFIGSKMLPLAGRSPARLTIITMLVVGLMSAFMNNIGAVAILMPAVISVARETGTSPSKLLIPLSFASLMGGNMTLIGTPPNILASSILESYGGLEAFGFFDFFPTGILALITGVVYMTLIGRHILPSRAPDKPVSDRPEFREFLTEVEVTEVSPLVGKSVAETRLGELYDLNALHIRHKDNAREFAGSDRRLRVGDVLLLEGSRDQIIAASRAEKLIQHPRDDDFQVEGDGLRVVEIMLAPGSRFEGRRLKEVDFRMRFGLAVMAIRHHGRSTVSGLADEPLVFGDVLLVEGPASNINLLRGGSDFLVLDTPPPSLRRTERAPLAVGILVVTIATVSLDILTTSTGMLLAALLIVLSGTITMKEAYRAIQWKSVFLIAGMLPLGLAMEETGTAQLMADQIVQVVGAWGPKAILIGIFLLTAVLTEVISNAAATVLVVPIAIDAALSIGANPHAFVMAVVLAASTSFLMPIGHQVNVIVFDAGKYRFLDYTRVGVWLNLLFLLLISFALPVIWPLF
jgi:di/tricarboxylate transporter